MATVPEALMERLLEPQPVPAGMSSREIVRRAVEFAGPPRIPYSFMVPLKTDFFETAILEWVQRGQEEKSTGRLGDVRYDEWGVGWEVTTRWWDHSFHHPLRDLGELESYYPQPWDIGLSAEMQRVIYESFLENGCAL
jgi:hypothetical protein